MAETVPFFAPFLSLTLPEDRYPPLTLSPQRQKQKTLETIVALLLELAEQQPVLCILEDLHWTDPTTLEFLTLLIDQAPTASLYTLLTCRPEFQPPWSHRSYLTEVTVNRLLREQITRMAVQIAGGKPLPDEVLQQLVDKTDGVPLFVEELTKAVLESGHLKDVDGHYALTGTLASLAIPATLHDSLMARLDRLVTAKGIAQYAAVIGRQFAYELLATVSQLDATTLQRELGRLVDAEIVYQRGLPPQSTYVFKHALIQDAAYQSLLKSTRQHYHQRIAQVLAAQFPETTEVEPELLAHHSTEAGLTEQAVHYWYQAGQRAIQRSAHTEAIHHLTQGLALLTTLPETPARVSQELRLLVALGTVLIAAKGFAAPEVEPVYTRAYALCQQSEDAPHHFDVLLGLWRFSLVRAELPRAYTLGQHLLTLAHRQQEPALLLGAHYAVGATLFFQGELLPAREHLEQGLALYALPEHQALAFHYGIDPGVLCGVYIAETLWLR
jgi:predicted ATPase